MTGFIAELRRRNMFRVAGAYGVVAWLLAQIAAVMESAFALPAWFDAVVIALLMLGFPLALFLAWSYETTPDGVRPTTPAAGKKPKKKALDLAILGALVAVAAVVMTDGFGVRFGGAPGAEASASAQAAASGVAVLPFLSLSSAENDAYFADGMAEEIINTLTVVREIEVSSRTASFAYRGKDTPVPDIASALGVTHIVEGSVRRSGDTGRVTAKLVRAADGATVWSEQFDRDLTEPFDVQTEIAAAVAQALGVYLDEDALARMERQGIRTVEAFVLNQKAYEVFIEGHRPVSIPRLAEATALFDRVLDVEPGVASAITRGSDLYAHVLMEELALAPPGAASSTGLDTEEASRRLQESYDRVLPLLDTAEARAEARADQQFLSRDWTGFGQRLDTVLETTSGHSSMWADAAALTFGRAEATLAAMLRGIEDDPEAPFAWTGAASAAYVLQDLDAALRYLDQHDEAVGPSATSLIQRHRILVSSGDLEGGRGLLEQGEGVMARMRVAQYAAEGDAQAGQAEVAAALAAEGRPFGPNEQLAAAAQLGDREAANALAAAMDRNPLGAAMLTIATGICDCGAPFDLPATPNFARQLEEAGFAWPPEAGTAFPLKDW